MNLKLKIIKDGLDLSLSGHNYGFSDLSNKAYENLKNNLNSIQRFSLSNDIYSRTFRKYLDLNDFIENSIGDFIYPRVIVFEDYEYIKSSIFQHKDYEISKLLQKIYYIHYGEIYSKKQHLYTSITVRCITSEIPDIKTLPKQIAFEIDLEVTINAKEEN